ncbi:hypothetical protein AYO21_10601 [Fonsecaea monophora]|uniref:Major facilitator superfamily (MFS) profile domain-containing protein n=1 Tax=Fonsecaea monophora TaxID=254056 RepID=A0A177ET57_9EURO|nr:hypothetical protein AYO21_10601 [Fonsecaea monophora]KAH0829694.1 siderophore iron transporter [Fonsecaea pedrosoi]OAG35203.1 hypothetical protein AYO21_10601 [Fonsecaea monophora]
MAETKPSLGQGSENDHIREDAIGGTSLDRRYYRSFRFLGSMVAFSLSLCGSYVGYLLPVGILTIINADIGPDANYPMIAVAWTISNALGNLLVGRLSDIFGRRYFLLVGNALGLLGFIVSAVARNISSLIGASVLIGLAASVSLTFYSAAGELVPIKDRGYWYFAIFVPVIPFGMFSAWLAHNFVLIATWRWCYYLAIIIQGVAVILLAVAYFPPSVEQLHSEKSRRQLISEIDYLGIFLYTAGTVLFLLGVSWGGSTYPWKSSEVIACLVVGGVTLILFFTWEGFGHPTSPLLPVKFLVGDKRGFFFPAILGGVDSMFYYGLTLIWPTQVNTVYTTGLRTEGWLASILSAASQTGTMVATLVFYRMGHQRIALGVAFTIMVGLTGGLTVTNPTNRALAIGLVTPAGFCIGFSETIILMLGQACRDPHMIGLAVGTLGFLRLLFGAVAQALYTTILSNRLATTLPRRITEFAVNAGLPTSALPDLFQAVATQDPDALNTVPNITSSVIEAVTMGQKFAYADAFSSVYWTAFAFGAVGVVLTPFVRKDVNDEMTAYVPKKLRGVLDDGKVADGKDLEFEKGQSTTHVDHHLAKSA